MEKRLKILMLTEDFLPIYGGITSVVEKSSLGLSKYVDITIGTVEVPKQKRESYKSELASYKVVRCKGFYNKITTNMQAMVCLDKKFRKEIEKEKYDIIHCHFPLSLYKYGLRLGKKTKTPVIITAHSIFYPDFKQALKFDWLAKLAVKFVVKRLNRANGIFCVSKFCKSNLIKYGLKTNSKVVYNAVDMNKDNKDNKDLFINFESKYNFNKETFVISIIGRLIKIKNISMLINALILLRAKGLNLILLIVGDGVEKENIQKLISKNTLNNYCVFTGPIRNRSILSELYKRSNLIAFPSIGDSAGLIQVEAAYFEKPTLAVENTAVSELMIDGENGLVSENNPENIAEKILYAYNNREKLTEIGKKAKETLYRSYFDEKVIQELLNNYKQVIEEYNRNNK